MIYLPVDAEDINLTEFDDYPIRCTTQLYELASSWKDLSQVVNSYVAIRQAHLIKLYYYRDEKNYEYNFKGWVASAKKGLEHVSKLKKGNKLPSWEKLYEIAWGNWEDTFDNFHKGIIKDLNKKYTDFQKIEILDFDGVLEFGRKFNQWICKKLSIMGKVNQEETEEKIKELLNLNF